MNMIVIFVLGVSLDQLERIKLPTGSFFRISAAHGEAGRGCSRVPPASCIRGATWVVLRSLYD